MMPILLTHVAATPFSSRFGLPVGRLRLHGSARLPTRRYLVCQNVVRDPRCDEVPWCEHRQAPGTQAPRTESTGIRTLFLEVRGTNPGDLYVRLDDGYGRCDADGAFHLFHARRLRQELEATSLSGRLSSGGVLVMAFERVTQLPASEDCPCPLERHEELVGDVESLPLVEVSGQVSPEAATAIEPNPLGTA